MILSSYIQNIKLKMNSKLAYFDQRPSIEKERFSKQNTISLFNSIEKGMS